LAAAAWARGSISAPTQNLAAVLARMGRQLISARLGKNNIFLAIEPAYSIIPNQLNAAPVRGKGSCTKELSLIAICRASGHPEATKRLRSLKSAMDAPCKKLAWTWVGAASAWAQRHRGLGLADRAVVCTIAAVSPRPANWRDWLRANQARAQCAGATRRSNRRLDRGH